MWCKVCNIETNEEICPVCGNHTAEDIPVEIHWCRNCNIPIIYSINQADRGICPICGNETKYMAADLRPVFPEERLLVELLLGKKPNEFLEKSVWVLNNRYYVDGKVLSLPSKLFDTCDSNILRDELNKYSKDNTYDYFNKYVGLFIEANSNRLNYLVDEATNFIQEVASKFEEENIVISFSGGKDSTVTADLTIKALSNPSLVHIFGDTTLEFYTTQEYAKRYREEHPYAIFQVARNFDQDFMEVCEDIGPPARMMRWCCSMFKTGPITRVLNNLYRNRQILSFYGIRKFESVSRSKYNRVEDDAESVKIQKQTVAAPIFFWKDIDVWLYILAENIDFNEAYRWGYTRVGCWCCPNNNQRDQFLAKVYMPDKAKEWREFLIRFAKKVGKPDPEIYVDSGMWKARQGGNGLAVAGDVKLKFTNCTTEEHAKIYRLTRPFENELIDLFIPFGRIAPELGKKLIDETVIVDLKTNIPILSIQPFGQSEYEYSVMIKTMNGANHDDLQRMAGYQIRKYNVCRKCLKCESLCKAGAISIVGDSYYINPDKCTHCKMCMTAKYLDGGCTMDKYLRTK